MVAIVRSQPTRQPKGRGDVAKYGLHLQQQKPTRADVGKPGSAKMAASSAVRIRLLYHIIRRQAEQRAKRAKNETDGLVKPKAIRCSAPPEKQQTLCQGYGCNCATCYLATERFQKTLRWSAFPSIHADLRPFDQREKTTHFYNAYSVSRPFSPITYYNALILNTLKRYHANAPHTETSTMWRPWM